MWKLHDSYSVEEKENLKREFRSKLLDLKGKIDVLQSIEVYLNTYEEKETNFDIFLDTSFKSMEDLKAYSVHPEHVKVVEFVNSLKLNRACVDSEY
jgi:predicted naringenin-chalcone synthase